MRRPTPYERFLMRELLRDALAPLQFWLVVLIVAALIAKLHRYPWTSLITCVADFFDWLQRWKYHP